MLDLQTLMQRKAKLDSDIARAKRKEKEAARRADSRRKIVLGGALQAAVKDKEISESFVRHLIDTRVADRDRKLFEDFVFEKPEAAPVSAESQVPDDDQRE